MSFNWPDPISLIADMRVYNRDELDLGAGNMIGDAAQVRDQAEGK
jgi:hypothetical protein